LEKDTVITKTADLCESGLYRYALTRIWKPEAGLVGFIMLNPSTADAEVDDATIRKCMGFADKWGYGGITVANLFAYRETSPAVLKDNAYEIDCVGPRNNAAILKAANDSQLLIAAWGNHGKLLNRDKAVRKLLSEHLLHSLDGLSKTGQPNHPLYKKYTSARMVMA